MVAYDIADVDAWVRFPLAALMKESYCQCLLQKKVPDGTVTQLSYIPEPFCKEGKVLKLKENDIWDDGWVVLSVGSKVTYEEANTRSRAYLKHRNNSDI